MFTKEDIRFIEQRGSSVKTTEERMKNFVKGFPFLNIEKPARDNDGLIVLNASSLNKDIAYYESKLKDIQVVKFVPASGAASRMFKTLFEFESFYSGSQEEYSKAINDKSFNSVGNFINNIQKFAFYNELNKAHQNRTGKTIEVAVEDKELGEIVKSLLSESGLNYGKLPKGLLKFHKYENNSRTPMEEHLVEGANYCKDKDNIVQLHFTVSPEHQSLFESLVNDVKANYEKLFGVKYDITFSIQKPSTDTIAVDLENNPFKNNDDSLLFRPGGHGALIENLNDIDGDIVFIKNIDNVVPDSLKEETYNYKKALAGILLDYQQKIFGYMQQLTENKEITSDLLHEIESFIEKDLCINPISDYKSYSQQQKADYFVKKLNRPVRVCGMVKNEGEPGGGPFWAKNSDGTISLQIVESSQIDHDSAENKEIMNNSTHFNPVDLVVGVKDYAGKKFNLPDFVDPETGFISIKSKDGKDLKAQELPGLWNGAMSNWNTIFAEVPSITFNPVKTVNDLLREQHTSD